MNIKSIDNLIVSNKTIIIRTDFNVPMINGNISDNTRIIQSKDTIQELRKKGGKIVIISHMGRPNGHIVPNLSLLPVVKELSKILNTKVLFSDSCITDKTKFLINDLKKGDVILLENLRFNKDEKKNDNTFAEKLAKYGNIFVNDAFSVSHRKHASIDAITQYLPSYAGRLMEKELNMLKKLQNPKSPIMVIIGGAKISSKINLLNNMATRVDTIAIVGGMANTFLYALGYNVGKSLCEKELCGKALNILDKLKERNCNIILPTDVVVSYKKKSIIVNSNNVLDNQIILDAGPQTCNKIINAIDNSKTLIWNGSLGMTEITPFDIGTTFVAKHASKKTNCGKLISIAGGGDTVLALKNANCLDDFTYVSLAGGAFLEWLEHKCLPGITHLVI